MGFILGFCKCGCGNQIKIITSSYEKGIGHWLQTYKSGHNRMDYSKRKLPTRENHPFWKGGLRKSRKYIKILRKHHKYADRWGYVYIHRYRKELELGRYLEKDERVHHIDHNTLNNDESNLMLFENHSKHITFERTKNMSGRICKYCKSTKTKIKTRNNKKYEEWYGNEIEGFYCCNCYKKLLYEKNKKLTSRN